MPADLQRFADMAPTTAHGDTSMFSGAQAPEGRSGAANAPSRVLMQQLHDAGAPAGRKMCCLLKDLVMCPEVGATAMCAGGINLE